MRIVQKIIILAFLFVFPSWGLSANILGNKQAKVVLEEYSSFTCPHCAYFHKFIMPELEKEFINTGKVLYVHHNFPTDELAVSASLIPFCINNGSDYFKFLNLLFLTQENWVFETNKNIDVLRDLMLLAGVSNDEFANCINNKIAKNKIMQEKINANKNLGVKVTPTLFINGKIFDKVAKYSVLADELNNEIKKFSN